MAHTTRNIDSSNFKFGIIFQKLSECRESVRNRVQFRAARAANGDDNFLHAARILSRTPSRGESSPFVHGAERASFPELSLFLARKTRHQEFLELFD